MPVSKKIYGVGTNDLPGEAYTSINGCRHQNQAYTAWAAMLKRCYSAKFKAEFPTYQDKYVCESWLVFSNFKTWFDSYYRPSWQLDKDTLKPGNKEYGPDFCLYIPPQINTFLSDCGRARGDYKKGVHKDKRTNRFISSIREGGKKKYLGTYETEDEAHSAWVIAKIILAERQKELCDSIHPQLFNGLINNIRSADYEQLEYNSRLAGRLVRLQH